jgi:hypothetical protein
VSFSLLLGRDFLSLLPPKCPISLAPFAPNPSNKLHCTARQLQLLVASWTKTLRQLLLLSLFLSSIISSNSSQFKEPLLETSFPSLSLSLLSSKDPRLVHCECCTSRANSSAVPPFQASSVASTRKPLALPVLNILFKGTLLLTYWPLRFLSISRKFSSLPSSTPAAFSSGSLPHESRLSWTTFLRLSKSRELSEPKPPRNSPHQSVQTKSDPLQKLQQTLSYENKMAPSLLSPRKTQNVDAPQSGKIAYAIVGSFSLAILAYCLARRLRNFHLKMPAIRYLIFAVYIVATLFILSAMLLQFGFGLNVSPNCRASIYICLVFYLSAKVLMYLFLSERLHIIHTTKKRRHDRLHIVNTLLICLGFGVIAILAFIYPVAQVSPANGQCRIGIKRGVTIPLLAFDLVINVWMTCCFVSLIRPFMRRIVPTQTQSGWKGLVTRIVKPLPSVRNGNFGHREGTSQELRGIQGATESADIALAKLGRNSLLGCLLVLSTTIANLTLVLVYQGHEQGWICFLVCSIDSKCYHHSFRPLGRWLT